MDLFAVLSYKADSNRNEIRILALLSKHGGSAHIPEIYGVLKEASGWLLAQEISNFGSVASVLQDPELTSMVTPEHKVHMAAQFAEAGSFLESLRIVHTDLACRNFLVFRLEQEPERTKVKLTDFMSALCLPANVDHIVKKKPQATRWCAPETVASHTWSYKTDVWSLGATLWELFTGGQLPWNGYGKRADVSKKLRELAEKLDASATPADLSDDFPAPESALCPPVAYTTLLSCLQPDANARPSSKRVAVAFKQTMKARPKAAATGGVRQLAKAEVASLASRAHEWRLPKEVTAIMNPGAGNDSEPSSPPTPQNSDQPKINLPAHNMQSPRRSLRKVSESGSSPAKFGIYAPTPPTRFPSTPAKVSESGSAPLKSGICAQTPPTRCPSTPEVPLVGLSSAGSGFASMGSGFASSPSFYSDASPVVARTTPPMGSPRFQGNLKSLEAGRLTRLMPHQLDVLDTIKALCAAPDVPQKVESLENMKNFLSTPEAVCGLGTEKLLILMRKVADAKVLEELSGQALPLGMPVYDTLVPLTPVNTWSSSPMCALRDPISRVQLWSTAVRCR